MSAAIDEPPLRSALWESSSLRHSFGELKLISSKFSYTQHSANKFASVFVCTNFPVVAKLVPMSVTQVYLQVTKRVQPSFAKAVHCYGIAMPSPLFMKRALVNTKARFFIAVVANRCVRPELFETLVLGQTHRRIFLLAIVLFLNYIIC